MARARDDRAERDRLAAELESLRPYLGLARELRDEVDALAAEAGAGGGALVAALDAVPQRERARIALEAFARLPDERQWEVVEAAFGDEEVRTHLATERAARRARAARSTEAHAVALAARAARRLATDDLPPGHELALGLFRAEDVHAGMARGPASQVCARLLVLRTTEERGRLQVLEDLFNPGRGLFVTADYDEDRWRAERLAGHVVVRVGALVHEDGEERFEAATYPGGRVDLDVDGDVRVGTLLLGFATFGDEDVFRAPS